MSNEIDFLYFFIPKILISTICGAIIGYDREIRNKVAGIRTNVLISVGVTILTSITFWLLKDNNQIDPTRMLGQIVTGIGFLGAGVIMKHDDKIIGVTTAAFIWAISTIGMIAGLGYYIAPLIITVGLLGITRLFEVLEKKIREKRN